jgi:hypothetical protein
MAGIPRANLRRLAGRPSLRGAPCDEQTIVATQKSARLLRRKVPRRRHPIADTHQRPAARHARDFARNVPPLKQRARGMPGARCTRSPLCNAESTGVEATGTPESPGIPARNGFNGLCRALVSGLFCQRRLADIVLSKPGWANKTPQNLTPASGRQDHTILPSAATSLVRVQRNRSRIPENPPCDPIARKTLPRSPHPAPRP